MTIDSSGEKSTPDNGSDTNYMDKQIAEYYKAQSLSPERYRKIVADQTTISDTREKTRKDFPTFYALAASVAAICTLLASYIAYESLSESRQDTSTQGISVASHGSAVTLAMREAALNHTTKLKFDYQPESLPALQSSMNKLPFDITLPQSLNPEETKLLGARYCSIEGELAAHLRLIDTGSHREFSLFMASAEPALTSLADNQVTVDNVAVRLWREQNILYLETTTVQ